MIKSLRRRLALTFVGLSSLVCVCLAAIGMTYMYGMLTAELDDELRVLASEFGHAIDVEAGKPVFRDWKRVVQTDPPRGFATIQLFSTDGKLLERYGPQGVPRLLHSKEVTDDHLTFRLRSSPLRDSSGKVIGFMQLQISTSGRDAALRQLAIMMGLGFPLLLTGLALTSLFVSGKAVKPLEENVDNMRTFLADAGHELNTPLSIIAAKAESLQRKLLRSGNDASDVEVIIRSAERTSRLANDLLLLSELEGAKAPRRSSNTSLDQLLKQVVQDFSDRFADKNIALAADLCDNVIVHAYYDDLYRAFANLLENALRYTDQNGIVRIILANGDGEALVTVEDSGIGIPEASLVQIFDRFYRVDKSRSRASGGSGLGLPIAKAIFDAHGAQLSVVSREGAGTKFSISMRTHVIDHNLR